MPDLLKIAVYSDVICPWCFVGKRRLERALREVAAEASVTWLPFELNPDMPPEGVERATYRARKFGAERSAELDANMTKLGGEEGIAFAFDRMARTPNTRKAHALIAHASRVGGADAVVEALFRAYFEEA
ncbi:MAG TPA: DsbA family oxidoreductase, partial [Beijerinckiaceae bacterium]|nr:DsbA family oxidoreductase [Beijerinckiaceae bacterium]